MMDKVEFQSLVRSEIEQAVNYHDTEFASDRITAMSYYMGEPLGNEVDGRSQVVDTQVSDMIEMIMPQLMRIFTASDDFVKFEPRGPEDVENARQATEYVNFILSTECDAWPKIHAWMKDSLLFRFGVIKHYFEEETQVVEKVIPDLTDEELTLLSDDDDIKIVESDMREDIETGQILYDVKVKHTERDGRVVIDNVPPEEFLFSQRAKSLDDCRFVAHRTHVTVSDLIDRGYDRDTVESHAGYSGTDTLNEKQARFNDIESQAENTTSDISQRDVQVTEVYIKADYDDDGKSEIRRVMCLGSAFEIVENEPFEMFPFSVLSPILMPHRMVGRGIAEMLIDLQKSKTSILRQLLDNIYLMNNARVGAVEGQVNLDDLMSNRPGGIVRMRAPGMVQPITPPSVADAAFPLMAYLDDVREMRTGMSKASMGLDADALQSSTAAAVNATVNAAQAKIEMIARVFAETGIKRLMKCILQIVKTHQPQEKIIRLRNTFVKMDPGKWENDFDISVNVGLGSGDDQQKMAILGQVLQKQEQALTQMGVDNPLCTLGQYRNTLSKMLDRSGIKAIDEFFLDPDNLPPEIQQKIQQKMQSAQANPQMQMEREKMQLEREKAESAIKLQREKLIAEMELKKQELQMKYEARTREMELEANLRAMESEIGIDISSNIPRA